MTWEKDGTHWPDDARDVREVEQGEQQTPAPTREEWTDAVIHHIEYRDAKGRLHREDGPAHSETWSNGYQYYAWHWHDKLHRLDGPAVTTMYRNGTRHEEWWEDNKRHRDKWTPAPKDSDEANVASLWKQERDEADDEAVEMLRRIVAFAEKSAQWFGERLTYAQSDALTQFTFDAEEIVRRIDERKGTRYDSDATILKPVRVRKAVIHVEPDSGTESP